MKIWLNFPNFVDLMLPSFIYWPDINPHDLSTESNSTIGGLGRVDEDERDDDFEFKIKVNSL